MTDSARLSFQQALPKFSLLSRSYCHLCDDMLIALRELLEGYAKETRLDALRDLRIDVVDVDADPQLVAQYDELVPVLLSAEGQVLCHYFLDTPKVREYLSAFR